MVPSQASLVMGPGGRGHVMDQPEDGIGRKVQIIFQDITLPPPGPHPESHL